MERREKVFGWTKNLFIINYKGRGNPILSMFDGANIVFVLMRNVPDFFDVSDIKRMAEVDWLAGWLAG